MTEAPERIWIDPTGITMGHTANPLDTSERDVAYARTDIARAALEAAEMAERDTLDQLFDEAAETRRTFCLATPGTDAEFKAWIHGFDTAVAHFADAIRSRGEKK